MTKKLLAVLLALVLCMGLAIFASAEIGEGFMLDVAGLLTDSEASALDQKLKTLSRTYNVQIVIATMDSLDGKDIDEFVEFAYDTLELGYGEDHDGILLLVCMDTRQFRILSNGLAADAIGMGNIEDITDRITPDLSDGDYAAAFHTFADRCEYYLDGHINGFPFRAGSNLVICLIIGLVVGLIVASVLKGQLKTVRRQERADVYVKQGSMHIDRSMDLFLYRTVTKTPKPKNNSSSRGGSSRNVGGGSF